VQLLTTEWTTESRGGAGARLRKTPLALVLPETWLGSDDGTLRIHHVYFSERNQFQPREGSRIRSGRSPFEEVEGFRVERTEAGVRVLLDHGRRGLPGAHAWSWERARGQPSEELLSVAPGEWGRAVYNERLSYWDTGHWGYCKHVLNVGLLREASPEVFLATEPEHEAVREFLPRPSGPASVGASPARIATAAP
jgi:hypothetical protein